MHTMLISVARPLWLVVPFFVAGLAWAQSGAASPQPVAKPPVSSVLKEVRSVEGITEYTLPNGLQVLLAPDDSKPSTTVNLTLKVGSRHENYGETGMAHLLEHLLFKGSKRHPMAWAEFSKRGLRSNGSTWLDRTNYFASFAASDANLDWYLDWLSDAMVNSFIARKDLDTEMTVVRNEMEMGENNPGRMLFEKTLSAMYTWHNYGKSTIGARTDVEQVDIARLQAFYRTWYRPDNATLIVSGKFKPQQVQRLVARYFGPLSRPTQPLPRLYTLDPVQDGERELTLRRAGGAPALIAAYHTVPGAHPDQAAAELLALVMGEAPAGRLHRQLTEKQLAAATWSWTPALHDPGFITFGADLAPGQDADAARHALLQTLESVSAEPITAAELERARVRWLKTWDQIYADPEQVGVALSESVSLGDWRMFFLLRDRVRDLPLSALQRFAQERLVQANRTLGVFLPVEKPMRAPAPASVDVAEQMRAFKPQEAARTAEAFSATPQEIERRTVRGRIGPAGAADGLQFALLPKSTRGSVVRATLQLRVGDEASLRGMAATADVLTALLDKGSRTLSRQQVQDRLDELRAELAFGFRLGVLTARLQARRDTLPALLDLVGQLLREPRLEPPVLEELRRQALTGLEQARKEPEAIVANALERHGNPYARGDIRHGRTFDEIAHDLQAVSVEGVRDFHARLLGAGQAQFSAVGDFEVEPVKAALEKSFGGWRAATAPGRVPQPLWAGAPTRMVFATPDKQNATMLVRQPLALTDRDPDYPALLLANYLLGQGGNSRLWVRIREKGGLSYDVRSGISWNPYEQASIWQASAIFAPANRDAVEKAFREEVDRALKDGFTDKELAEGKSGLLNLRRLALAQDDALSGLLSSQLELGRTMDHTARLFSALQALNKEQVNAALRRHLKPETLVTAVGGDFK
jgi:zinc protease